MSGEDLDADCLSIKERTARRGRSPRRIFLSRPTLEAIVFHSPPPPPPPARALLFAPSHFTFADASVCCVSSPIIGFHLEKKKKKHNLMSPL